MTAATNGPPIPRGYPTAYLTCRDMRHPWSLFAWYRGDNGDRYRVLTCDRCGAERTDHWEARTGVRLPAKYDHPDDYIIPGGVDMTDVRKAVLKTAKFIPWADVEKALNKRRSTKR